MSALEALATLWFPPTCIACGVLLRGPRSATELCVRCGVAAVALPAAATTLGAIAALLPYQPPWSTALARLKFSGRVGLAGPLGRRLASAPRLFRAGEDGAPWDAWVPVPLFWRRRVRRGFDQTLLLALAAARHAAGSAQGPNPPPVLRRALVRTRGGPPQSRLPANARARNVAGAFVVPRAARVRDRRLLLIDDVTTTGATLRACAEALRAAGAAHVEGLALLRTLPTG